jgi:hypothetical protein
MAILGGRRQRSADPADIFTLCGAFDLKEQDPDESASSMQQQASLVECLLTLLGVSLEALIEAITSLAG